MTTFEESRHYLPSPVELKAPKAETIKFERWSDVLEFANKEFEFWKFSDEPNKRRRGPQVSQLLQFRDWVRDLLSKLRQAATSGPASPNLAAAESNQGQITNILEHFRLGLAPCSATPMILRAGEIGEGQPALGIAIAMISALDQSPPERWSQVNGLDNNTIFIALSAIAASHLIGQVVDTKDAAKRLNDMRTEWSTRFDRVLSTGTTNIKAKDDELQQAFEKARDEAYRHMQSVQALFDTHSGNTRLEIAGLEEKIQSLRTQLADEHAKAEKDLERLTIEIGDSNEHLTAETQKIRDAYEVQLQLRVPAKYWSEKVERHKKAFRRWLGSFVAVAASALVLAVALQWGLNKALTDLSPTAEFGTRIAANAFYALAAVWLLRHISKVVSDNLRLGNDAEHRQMLVQTFVALIGDGKIKNEEPERLTMLQAILRPIADSPEGETPPTVITELLKNIGNKG